MSEVEAVDVREQPSGIGGMSARVCERKEIERIRACKDRNKWKLLL